MPAKKLETLAQAVKRLFDIDSPEELLGRTVTFFGAIPEEARKYESCSTIVEVGVESETSSKIRLMLSGGWIVYDVQIKQGAILARAIDPIYKFIWHGTIKLHPKKR